MKWENLSIEEDSVYEVPKLNRYRKTSLFPGTIIDCLNVICCLRSSWNALVASLLSSWFLIDIWEWRKYQKSRAVCLKIPYLRKVDENYRRTKIPDVAPPELCQNKIMIFFILFVACSIYYMSVFAFN